MNWTHDQDVQILMLLSHGVSLTEIGRTVGKTRSAVAGRLTRLGAPGYSRPRIRYQRTRKKLTTIDRGDWDMKTFEPYEIRKLRRARERLDQP